MDTPMIDPKNLPAWTVAAFALALIAMATALISLRHIEDVAVFTQAEVLALNKKISDGKGATPAAPVAQAPAAAGDAQKK